MGKRRRLSGGGIAWTEGMLSPVLRWMEQEGLIESEWRQADNGRRHLRDGVERLESARLTTEEAFIIAALGLALFVLSVKLAGRAVFLFVGGTTDWVEPFGLSQPFVQSLQMLCLVSTLLLLARRRRQVARY